MTTESGGLLGNYPVHEPYFAVVLFAAKCRFCLEYARISENMNAKHAEQLRGLMRFRGFSCI